MKNLHPIADRPLKIFDAIVAAKHWKHRTTLTSLRVRIQRAYARYRARKHNLERLRAPRPRWTTLQANALRHCYAGATNNPQSSSPRDRLCVAVRRLSDDCAYCGAHTTSTLDHYLSKDEHPEFAVLPLNLVPSCTGCNKPRPIVDQSGRRALINPYFDPIPDEPFLEATIDMIGGAPVVTFAIVATSSANKAFRDLYARHCGLLGLLGRYKRRAEAHLLSRIRATVRAWGATSARVEVKACLKKQAEERRNDIGANDMEVALLLASAASDPFLDYCFN